MEAPPGFELGMEVLQAVTPCTCSAPCISADDVTVRPGVGDACRGSTRALVRLRTEAEPSDALPQPGEMILLLGAH